MNHVVVVESPAKAKTINKYLGNDYTVLASFGHVRDLPSKDGSVRPDEDFDMTYEVDGDSKKHINAIKAAMKGADTLYLATDPDREGEAISWHLLEALKENKALKKDMTVQRIVFHEITKKAVQNAIEHPRDIDMDLVNAQQARRALDYLVGFNLSPILWRKLPGSRSAGRVQSVALRLICERDQEIEQFVPREYWDITADLKTEKGDQFSARLTHYDGEKLDKFAINNEKQATAITAVLESKHYQISTVTPKQVRRNPYPPFTTSTLQMDASRKLGFGTKKTMQLAQKLYEGIDIGGETTGLITYMRTDGVDLSTEAVMEARDFIGKKHGENYLPDSPRMYKSKAKNAQEAHEAIRPTSVHRTPESLAKRIEGDMLKLYTLIWKRTVACQMMPAVYDQVAVELEAQGVKATLRATGSVLKFDGFLALYQVGKDEDEEDENSQRLPELTVGENADATKISPEQHFTQPPPRFTEASLVKRLEELGIGRPSTYASIIAVLIDRKYATLEKKRFMATSLGRLVSAFLVSFFPRYVEYDFTAQMEESLDEVADGKQLWKDVLRDFWSAFIAKIDESKNLTITDVLETLDEMLEPFTFGTDPEAVAKARVCPTCGTGRLSLKTGRYGAFLGCSNYPDCSHTKQLVGDEPDEATTADGQAFDFPRILGAHPDSGLDVVMKKGPYGVYLQMGDGKEAKRAGLPKGQKPEDVTLELASGLLNLPREVGSHPETGEPIMAGIGRYGPYLLHKKVYTSLTPDDDVMTVGMNRAVTLIAENAKKKGNEPIRVIGEHPEDKEEIAVYSGRYGPYIKYKKINATIPKDAAIEELTMEDALDFIAKKQAAGTTKKKKAPAKKKTTAKKKAS